MEILSGPYRKVSKSEYLELMGKGVPGEWDEGCGYVVYDQKARDNFLEKIGSNSEDRF